MLYIAFSINLKKYGFVRSNRTKVLEDVKHILRAHQSFQLCGLLPHRLRKMYESSFIQGPRLVSRELRVTGHNKPYSYRPQVPWEDILNSGWETTAIPTEWGDASFAPDISDSLLYLEDLWQLRDLGDHHFPPLHLPFSLCNFSKYLFIKFISHWSSGQYAGLGPHFKGPLANLLLHNWARCFATTKQSCSWEPALGHEGSVP